MNIVKSILWLIAITTVMALGYMIASELSIDMNIAGVITAIVIVCYLIYSGHNRRR